MKSSSQRLKDGLKVRIAVHGKEYVDKAFASATDFTLPFQELVTEYCWGTIWTRPGLSHKIRSMLNLAMLTALNRPDELKMHVMGAVRNGCSEDEIREVLLQTAIYCGIPASLEAFKVAEDAIKSMRSSSRLEVGKVGSGIRDRPKY